MRRIWLATLLFPALGFGEEALTRAEQAMQDGLPDIAVVQLRKALADSPTDAALNAALARALIASGDGEGALRALENVPPTPELLLVRGKALALQGRWNEAESVFVEAAKQPDLKEEAGFYAAESARLQRAWERAVPVFEQLQQSSMTWRIPALRRLAAFSIETGDLKRAAELLEKSEAEDAESVVLAARLLVAEGKNEQALARLERFKTTPPGLSPEIATVACMVQAEALTNLKRPDEARKSLEQFVQQSPENRFIGDVINRLVVLDRDAAEKTLERWLDEGPQLRRAVAILALAKLKSDNHAWEEASRLLARFTTPPLSQSPLAEEALRKLIRLRITGGDWNGALSVIALVEQKAAPSERLELAQTRARIAVERGEFSAASKIYASMTGMENVSEERAAYFQVLAALWGGEETEFATAYENFSRRYPESSSRPGLLLDRGLFFADREDERAVETLRQFVAEFPKHPRVDEARLALAELAFAANPPDFAAAKEWLIPIAPDSDSAEAAAYMRIWLSPGLQEQSAATAKEYLVRWPRSERAGEVYFKLGELYFQNGDFANAQAAFERLLSLFPEHPLSSKASYFAGISMLRTMNPQVTDQAILALENAARRDPTLRHAARLAQAEAYVNQSRYQEALVVYEDVLKSNPDAPTRAAALAGKGTMHFNKAEHPAALETFELVLTDPEISPDWKQEALWRKGKSLEMAGDTDSALLAYYEAIKIGEADQENPGGALFWFYKSGFDAARILESRQRWPAAVALYRKLAQLGGPRSEEALARAKRLQLEHYLWNEE